MTPALIELRLYTAAGEVATWGIAPAQALAVAMPTLLFAWALVTLAALVRDTRDMEHDHAA